jgi:PAS domain S-box-containing protein
VSPSRNGNDLPAVLLVDDRQENLLALRAVLEPLPCRLVAVNSGEEALKALLQDDFAVVLLDVQMPGMDGFETAEMIKQRQRTRTIPIIFVTAISKERHNVFRGYTTGAVDYVVKPYDPGVLRSKVSVFLDLDAKSRAAAASEAMLRAAFDYAPHGMARLDMEGRIAEANRAFASLLGYGALELRDRLFDSLLAAEDVGQDADRRAALVAGALSGYERVARLCNADDEQVPCAMSFSLARPGGGVPEAIIVQVKDLREQRRAEAERDERIRAEVARSQAERTSERLRAIQGISDAALSTLAFDDLVRELLHRTTEALGVDTAAVVLYEDEGASAVYQVAVGVDTGTQVRRWNARRDAIVARPEDEGPPEGGSVEHPLGQTIASTMSMPLVVDREEIGALHVGTLFARRFTRDDWALLELAADRAALGIQRARLFHREHAIAVELQRSLLPAALPEVPGVAIAARYFAAGSGTQVGGDWYDMVVQPDGRLLLIIGDVAGRGIAAASTMGQLRSALRAYALDGHSPGSLLERLNAFQIGLRNRGMTTVMLASVDVEGRRLTYAKAGHPPALLVDAAGATRWLDDVQGVPLGALDDAVYREAETELSPGSTLVLYTDGLVELRSEMIDRGFERLRAAAIAAPDQIDALCDVILERTLINPDVDDDVTLLVLRMAGARRRRTSSKLFDGHRPDMVAKQLAKGTWRHEPIRSARVELTGGAGASAAARQMIADTFGGVASEQELADLRLLLAEVVTNAVIHGGTGEDDAVVVYAAATAERLRVEICNDGPAFEPAMPSGQDQPGGFGLLIVDRLSSRWGVDDDEGVCVWFEIDRGARPEATSGAGAPA